jgi:uncharacterized membrane protein
MKKPNPLAAIIAALALLLISAAAVHAIAVLSAPSLIMGIAIDRVSANGQQFNQWQWRDRVNPSQRDIVQPSPDLAYGACAYDLQRGPVRITIMPGASYVSLSLYADNTDNFFTINDRAMNGQPIEIALIGPGGRAPQDAKRVVQSPSTRGLALERRLAPTAEAFAGADAVRRAGRCERWNQQQALP